MHKPLIIGIATVDAIAQTICRFPSPGGLQQFDNLTLTTGGCAVNTAMALARLGVGADVIARVGCDPHGQFVLAELARQGVATGGVACDGELGTSFSFVAVHPGGERSFLHTAGANAHIEAGDIPDSALEDRPAVLLTGVMVMDRLDGEPAAEVLRRAHAAGAITIMDTVFVEEVSLDEWRRRVLPALPAVSYFVPSLAEARAITGCREPHEAARALRDAGASRVAIKLGEKGVLCVDERGCEELLASRPVEVVVDATGAGDCWCAGFIAGLLGGETFVQAAALGNAVAGISVTGAGATAAVPSIGRVRQIMGEADRRGSGRTRQPSDE